MSEHPRTVEAETVLTFRRLAQEYYTTSAKSGFHRNDYLENVLSGTPIPDEVVHLWDMLQDSNRLMLIVGEASEAHEQIRAGRAVDEIYYTCAKCKQETKRIALQVHFISECCGAPCKPEGVLSELADVVIRIFDMCGARRLDLGAMMVEKAAYNKSREELHGKKF
jgi:hypothetical protein